MATEAKSQDFVELSGEEPSQITEEAPNGGTRAWMTALGAAFIFFCGLGFVNSFGVFQQYYITHQLQDESPDNIAWIGSISAFLQFAVGALAGPLFDRFGAWVIRPAAILYVFSMMMMSLCSKYWHFMLCQGLLMGTALGLLIFPAMAAVSQYFDKKGAAALGLVISGSSIGGIVFPIALSKLLNESSLGFGWTLRVVGFVILALLAFACIAIKERLPPRTTTFFIGSAFRKWDYNLLILSIFFMFAGMFTPLFFIPSYAVTRGVDPTLASYFLAILNAASTFGRVIPGVLADKFGRLNILSLAGITSGIIILCLNAAKTTAGLVVYSIVIGFASGAIISGAAAAFAVVPKDPKNIGTYMGMGMAVGSLAALIGPPVNGALVNKYGGFSQAAIFSGIMCLVGGAIGFLSKAATPEGILSKR